MSFQMTFYYKHFQALLCHPKIYILHTIYILIEVSALNEHLRPMSRHKHLKYMQASGQCPYIH